MVLAAGCLASLAEAAGDQRPAAPLAAPVRQVLIVTVPDWRATTGTVERFSRDTTGSWRAEGSPAPVVVGRGGSGWGIGLHPAQKDGPWKREGDGRSPAGVFAVGPAFGSQPTIETGLDYLPLDGGHWCIDVPDSPHYNRIVHERDVGRAAVAGSTEPMRRDIHLDGDPQYRLGFVIGHNPAGEPAAGSCIFAHPWLDERTPTGGCVGLSAAALAEILAWLEADAAPRLVLLPESEYDRLRTAWCLPDRALGSTP